MNTSNDQTLIDAQADAQKATATALATVDGVEGVTLDSYSDVEETLPIIAELRSKREQIDGIRKKWTMGLKAVIDDINAQFKPGIEAYKKAEDHLKKCVGAFTQGQLDRRDELLGSVKDATTPAARQAIVESTEALVPPKLAGLSIRETWQGKVTDAGGLMTWILDNDRYDLLRIDDKALEALTKAQKADPGIPGWTVWKESTAVVTPSKIK